MRGSTRVGDMGKPTWTWCSSVAVCYLEEEDPEKLKSLEGLGLLCVQG